MHTDIILSMMNGPESDRKKVLITGGSSGLGFCLARFYLDKGFDVAVTGRKPVSMNHDTGRFIFVTTDFSDLRQTSSSIKQLCEKHQFDIVINNAGILSPPHLHLTNDGMEYTFQVNFLSQLLVNEIIISKTDPGTRLLFAAVTSMAYRIAGDPEFPGKEYKYRPFKAYSASKHSLATMSAWLPGRHPGRNIRCIAVDPGIFSSHIYRMQRKWFRIMYVAGSLFMRKPKVVAERFGRLTLSDNLIDSAIYSLFRRKVRHPITSGLKTERFWEECYQVIEPFI